MTQQLDMRTQESAALFELMSSGKSTYSVDDRLSVVMMYISEGNMKKVEKQTGIPYVTLASWKEADWWNPAMAYCHKKKDKELENKLSRVINDSVSEIHDRVMNGDIRIDKNGEKTRVPIPGRELASILNVVHDKRQLIRGEATSLSIAKDSSADKLKALEDKFNQFSSQLKAKTIEGEVVSEYN